MSSWITRWFSRQTHLPTDTDPMKKFLITGLGNIGDDYQGTRHNIGFQILDALAEEAGFAFETARLGDVGSFRLKGRQVLCLKPSTYMNRSGKAVRHWLEREKIPMEHLLVVTDDLNLPFGTLRLKTRGSDGGHNGLKDIQQVLGSTQYARFRFGIGSEYARGRQVDFVLGRWNEEEQAGLPGRLKRSGELIQSFVLAGAQRTMNTFNGT